MSLRLACLGSLRHDAYVRTCELPVDRALVIVITIAVVSYFPPSSPVT